MSDAEMTWRQRLAEIISDLKERKRIAQALGIAPVTLTRWTKEYKPRPYLLRALLNSLPEESRDEFLFLLTQEFPTFSPETVSNDPEDGNGQEQAAALFIETTEELDDIPSAFYAQALSTYVATPLPARFFVMSHLLLQQAVEQLDPRRVGIELVLARCSQPSQAGKVRSLRESTGVATSPFGDGPVERMLFLGAESLVGYAVISRHMALVQDTRETTLPIDPRPQEQSALAMPIMLSGNIAGALLVSSTEKHAFYATSFELIQRYTHLLTLAFTQEDWYDPQDIELLVMPPTSAQLPRLSTFRERVSRLLNESARQGQPINSLQAEQIVWQQLEEELLHLPPETLDSSSSRLAN